MRLKKGLLMPKLIPDAEFSKKFSGLERNHDDLNHFLSKGVEDYYVEGISLPEGYRLVKSRQDATHTNGGELIRIRLIYSNEGVQETIYAVNLVLLNDLLVSNRHCTQIMVWRSPYERYEEVLFRFAKKMFLHFIQEYIVIASDSEQTSAGRRFWQVRIIEALSRGENVYFLDCNDLDDNKVAILHRIESEAVFNEVWFDHGWGVDDEYKDRLFLISRDLID